MMAQRRAEKSFQTPLEIMSDSSARLPVIIINLLFKKDKDDRLIKNYVIFLCGIISGKNCYPQISSLSPSVNPWNICITKNGVLGSLNVFVESI